MLPLTATFLVLGGRQSEIRTRNAVNLAFFSTSLLQLSRSQSSFLCQSFHKRYTLFRKRSLSPRPPLAEILKFNFEKIFRLAPLGGSKRTFKFFQFNYPKNFSPRFARRVRDEFSVYQKMCAELRSAHC